MFNRINRFEKCLIDLHSYRRLIKNYFTFVKKNARVVNPDSYREEDMRKLIKCPRGESR